MEQSIDDANSQLLGDFLSRLKAYKREFHRRFEKGCWTLVLGEFWRRVLLNFQTSEGNPKATNSD